jgi:hypothetical protein
MARALTIAGLLVVAVVSVAAAGHREMLAARQELKLARDHQRAAAPEYAGHRGAALDYVSNSLSLGRLITDAAFRRRIAAGRALADGLLPSPPLLTERRRGMTSPVTLSL